VTPAQMADIQAAAFVNARGWTTGEFAELLSQPHSRAFTAEGGFALARTVAGETELLTLAVHPCFQRRGIAHGLMQSWLTDAALIAEHAFLEVATDNHTAIALYVRHGFARNAVRKAYYARPGSAPCDAVVMTRALTRG